MYIVYAVLGGQIWQSGCPREGAAGWGGAERERRLGRCLQSDREHVGLLAGAVWGDCCVVCWMHVGICVPPGPGRVVLLVL